MRPAGRYGRSVGRSGGRASHTGAPWEASPSRPKGGLKSRQNELQRHSKKANKSENYIHINKIHANSRSTVIQRPTSISTLLVEYVIFFNEIRDSLALQIYNRAVE